MASPHTIHKIELDESLAVKRAGIVEAERAGAIRDLLDHNHFAMPGHHAGPYYVRIAIDGHRLVLHVRDSSRTQLDDITLSLSPLRPLIRDYFLICDSFHAAFAHGDKARLESIDMARRGLHDEGATLLRERLAAQVEIDHATARSLFTLVCVLQIGRNQKW